MSLPRASVITLIALALALGACGRKGALKPPEGEEDTYTYSHTYPAPETVVPETSEEIEEGSFESEEITKP